MRHQYMQNEFELLYVLHILQLCTLHFFVWVGIYVYIGTRWGCRETKTQSIQSINTGWNNTAHECHSRSWCFNKYDFWCDNHTQHKRGESINNWQHRRTYCWCSKKLCPLFACPLFSCRNMCVYCYFATIHPISSNYLWTLPAGMRLIKYNNACFHTWVISVCTRVTWMLCIFIYTQHSGYTTRRGHDTNERVL